MAAILIGGVVSAQQLSITLDPTPSNSGESELCRFENDQAQRVDGERVQLFELHN